MWRIWTYFTAHQTRHYLDILPRIVDSYRNTYLDTIGAAPNHVLKKDDNGNGVRLYASCDKQLRPKVSKAKNGQMSRISKVNVVFHNGYILNWSENHFLFQGAKSWDLSGSIKGEEHKVLLNCQGWPEIFNT